ncbi:preprotein translocase subunit SecY [Reyranella sp. CPCC 100927]|uniref:preprotein translocase subunit SecY n=1 Tax=Reyranella sp. CPCC 100927 TaxID=2599616 RepID=UPI0011B477B1|nr:preprotein translocase subunit SecY [Reyranella sp. CPCC 100927]TWT05715.1 preprotein translocase subunit SecY [Reyranella sp. CPCC 100927]
MASAAEQLAKNLNWANISKATELKKRLWFTLGALIVYRIGSYIPLPGVDPAALAEMFQRQAGGIAGLLDVFSGGSIGRMSILALSIMPYISASIIMQILTTVIPSFEAMKKEGEAGRKKINQYTRYGTVFLAVIQAYSIAVGLETQTSSLGPVVVDPGLYFRFVTVVTLTGGTLFLMWLGEQVTSRGVGNGISLIIFAGIVAAMPGALVQTLELGRTGALSALFIIGLGVGAVAVVAFTVFVELSQRRILVQYPKRFTGYGSQVTTNYLPLKINTAGVIPPIFASSLLLFPATLAGFQGGGQSADWMQWIATYLGHGQPLYLLTYILLIVFFCFFYTTVVFQPTETAENLKKYGGFLPGIRPGKNTADYLEYVLTRITVIGSLYLAAVCIIPELLISRGGVPFYFGGTSLLIVVSVTLDTINQVQSHLMAYQYGDLIGQARLKGGKGR